jgi:hypothetical protein
MRANKDSARMTRRRFLRTAAALGGAAAAGRLLAACGAPGLGGAAGPLKIGLLVPSSGIYAALGESITLGHALLLSVREHAEILERPHLVALAAGLFLVAVVERDRLVAAPLLHLLLRGVLALFGELSDVLFVIAAGLGQLLAPCVEIGCALRLALAARRHA